MSVPGDAREALVQGVLRVAVAQAALQLGAVGISQCSLDTLTDVLRRYIEEIGFVAGRKAELAGRTAVNAHDLMDSLGGLGLQLRQLVAFRARVQNQTAFAFASPTVEAEPPRVVLAGPPVSQIYRQQLAARARRPGGPPSSSSSPPPAAGSSSSSSSSSSMMLDDDPHVLENQRSHAEALLRRMEQNVALSPAPPTSQQGSAVSTEVAAPAAGGPPLLEEYLYPDPGLLLKLREEADSVPDSVAGSLQPHLPLFLPQPPDRLWMPPAPWGSSLEPGQDQEQQQELEEGGQALRRIQQNRRVESVLGRLRRRDDSFRPRNFLMGDAELLTAGSDQGLATATGAAATADALWLAPDPFLGAGGRPPGAGDESQKSSPLVTSPGDQAPDYFGQLRPAAVARFPPLASSSAVATTTPQLPQQNGFGLDQQQPPQQADGHEDGRMQDDLPDTAAAAEDAEQQQPAPLAERSKSPYVQAYMM